MSDHRSRPQALLVEQPSLAMVTADFLDAIGFDAVHVHSAADALQVVAGRRVSLALIGGSLPDMPGAELARRVRELAPDLPMVLASGVDAEGLAERFSGDVGLCVLAKPYNERELRAAITAAGGSAS